MIRGRNPSNLGLYMYVRIMYMHTPPHVHNTCEYTYIHTHHTHIHMERRKGGTSDLVKRGDQWKNIRRTGLQALPHRSLASGLVGTSLL